MKEMNFEAQLRSIANRMEYPQTPDIAGAVGARLRQPTRSRFISKLFVSAQRRRLAWSLTLAFILLSSLMLIPPARAAILEFIQIGVVRIFRAEPTPIAPPQSVPPMQMPVTATPAATEMPQVLIPLLERLAGEMTLEDAQARLSYPLLLPSYPAELGPPDRIFVQDADGPMTIMVWLDPQDPGEIQMSLHFLPPDSWAIKKVEPTMIEETRVDGIYAIWAVGPYPLRYKNGDLDFTRMIDGHVLIWQDSEITYRLETELPLEEAIKIAESLQPIP
jgi:hypothetical protein